MFEDDVVVISTRAGDFEVEGKVFAKASDYYYSLYSYFPYGQNKYIYYIPLKNETFIVLPDCIMRQWDNASCREIIDNLNCDILCEIFIFFSFWDIDGIVQTEIISKIQKEFTRQDMLGLYNQILQSNISCQIIENEITGDSFTDYFNILIEDKKLGNEYNFITMEMILRLVSLKMSFIKSIKERFVLIYDLYEKCNEKKLFCLIGPKEFDQGSNDQKMNIVKVLSQSSDDYLLSHISELILREKIKNVSLTHNNNMLVDELGNIKEFFIDLPINESSSDIELLDFHEQFLKNKSFYFCNGKSFELSETMIERGVRFWHPRILLQSIIYEKDERKAISSYKEGLKIAQPKEVIDVCIALNNKGLYSRLNKIIDLVCEKDDVETKILLCLFTCGESPIFAERQRTPVLSEKMKKSVKKIIIPKTAKNIPEGLFKGFSNLSEVIIENGLECIKQEAFYECKSLKSIYIPKSTKQIEKKAFYNCVSLKKITFEDGIEEIGNNAFSGCIKITKIHIPKTCKNINQDAFSDCIELAEIELEDGIENLKHGVFQNCNSLRCFHAPKSIKTFHLSECKGLEKVILDEGIEKIDSYAFNNCEALTEVILNEGLKHIENSAFFGCSKLQGIKLPKTVVTIEEEAFKKCISLQAINLSKHIQKIGKGAFSTCTSLKKIYLGKEITSIEESTFFHCGSLLSVEIPCSVKTIGQMAFFNCLQLNRVTLGDNIEEISTGAFSGCRSLELLEIPNSIKQINEETFYMCTKLERVILGQNVRTIGEKAFCGCPIESIIIPKSVRYIESEAFCSCIKLKNVIFEDSSNLTIDRTAFSGCVGYISEC